MYSHANGYRYSHYDFDLLNRLFEDNTGYTHWAIPLFNRTPLQMTINDVQGVVFQYVPGGSG